MKNLQGIEPVMKTLIISRNERCLDDGFGVFPEFKGSGFPCECCRGIGDVHVVIVMSESQRKFKLHL